MIDVLPTQQDSQPYQLPGPPYPLPRFMEPWHSQPEASSAEEPPANPLAVPPTESPKENHNYQPDTQEIHVDTTARVSQFGWAIRKPSY